MLAKIKHTLIHPERWVRWLKYFFLDIKFGKKYLGKIIFNQNETQGYVHTASSDYDALNIIFSKIDIKENDVIVDVGCGKGRVFNWILKQGYKNQLIGIEVDPFISNFTRQRLANYPQVQILTAAIENKILPAIGTIFYMFHPFGESLVLSFANELIDNIQQGTYAKSNRPLIIYYNSKHLNVFEENPFWKISKLGSISFMGLPCAIIEPNVALT